jgi:hypothetical protein
MKKWEINRRARCQNQSQGHGHFKMNNQNNEKQQKVTTAFKDVILTFLSRMADSDPLFAVNFQKPEKNIDDCINYIYHTVKESGINGFTDEEVFGMAAHYYDENDLKAPGAIQCQVIVNHTIKLTDHEISEAKKIAYDQVVSSELRRLQAKPAVKKADNQPAQTSLFQ